MSRFGNVYPTSVMHAMRWVSSQKEADASAGEGREFVIEITDDGQLIKHEPPRKQGWWEVMRGSYKFVYWWADPYWKISPTWPDVISPGDYHPIRYLGK